MRNVRKATIGRPTRANAAGCLYTAMAVAYLILVLTAPAAWLQGAWLPAIPVEALALLALSFVHARLGERTGRWLLRISAGALLVLVALSAGDALLRQTFGRPLDIPVDIVLLPALVEFSSDALGESEIWGWCAATVLAAVIVYACNLLALRVLSRSLPAAPAIGAATGVLALIALGQLTTGRIPVERCAFGSLLSCRPSQVIARQVASAAALWRPMPAFDRALAADRLVPAEEPLLTRLRQTDVLLVFVESYGTVALRDPRYASRIVPLLERVEKDLRGDGLALASGALRAPTVGGLSWLSHATMLSGIWLDSQRLYNRLIASDRRTLVHLFGAAGHRTVGIFPQILRPWPEGRFFGYDRIWTSENIDYAGPRFGWTTMPDQYALWFLQRKERAGSGPRLPLFAEVALISSHAPWEPVPAIVEDWESLGTGARFGEMVDANWEGPEGWPEEAPRNYARAIRYSLDTIAGFAARFVDGDTLMIVLGDHQPAPLITGPDAGRAVPVHVIAGDPDLVRPFREWGFSPSMLPSPGGKARRMDAFRDWFVHAFSEPGPAQAATSRRLE